MKPINIKIMMALIEKEPGDQYIPVLKPVLMQILTELKHLRLIAGKKPNTMRTYFGSSVPVQ